MQKDQFSFEEHMEYSLILQTCYYRLDAFFKALKSTYGEEHEAVQTAMQALDKLNELKISMDDMVINECPERRLSCVYRSGETGRKTPQGDLDSQNSLLSSQE